MFPIWTTFLLAKNVLDLEENCSCTMSVSHASAQVILQCPRLCKC